MSDSGLQAFRWAESGGIQGLGDLGGGANDAFESSALGVSADGTFVVGQGTIGSTDQAFLWTPTGGMIGLGDLGGGGRSRAWDVSDEGSVIVGDADAPGVGQRAFIWTASGGMQRLDVILAALGVDLGGWRLEEAVAVSADGLTIAGTGTNPSGDREAWMAVIPEPSTALLIGLGLTAAGVRKRATPLAI